MKNFVNVFLMKSVLGRHVEAEDQESVIEYCIKKAYDDMMVAGRFCRIKGKNERAKQIKKRFEDNNYHFSTDLIKKVAKEISPRREIRHGKHWASSFGLAQKVVNMTFKYLYCFRDYIDREIDFTNCDCPVDSLMLKAIKQSNYTWSQLTEDDYDAIQKVVDKIELPDKKTEEVKDCSHRLLYDFIVAW